MTFLDETKRIDEADWLLKADRRYHGPSEWTGEDRRVQNLRDAADSHDALQITRASREVPRVAEAGEDLAGHRE